MDQQIPGYLALLFRLVSVGFLFLSAFMWMGMPDLVTGRRRRLHTAGLVICIGNIPAFALLSFSLEDAACAVLFVTLTAAALAYVAISIRGCSEDFSTYMWRRDEGKGVDEAMEGLENRHPLISREGFEERYRRLFIHRLKLRELRCSCCQRKAWCTYSETYMHGWVENRTEGPRRVYGGACFNDLLVYRRLDCRCCSRRRECKDSLPYRSGAGGQVEYGSCVKWVGRGFHMYASKPSTRLRYSERHRNHRRALHPYRELKRMRREIALSKERL